MGAPTEVSRAFGLLTAVVYRMDADAPGYAAPCGASVKDEFVQVGVRVGVKRQAVWTMPAIGGGQPILRATSERPELTLVCYADCAQQGPVLPDTAGASRANRLQPSREGMLR